MTDTTKPTGDTIDDVAAWLSLTFGPAVNRTVRYNPPGLPNGYWEDLADELLSRLAERPNQAVARGDVDTAINNGIANAYADFVDAYETHVYPDGLTFDGRLEAIRDAIDLELAALTTPTETTDPAMEGDDAE